MLTFPSNIQLNLEIRSVVEMATQVPINPKSRMCCLKLKSKIKLEISVTVIVGSSFKSNDYEKIRNMSLMADTFAGSNELLI